jgi:hypothetical protein
MISIRSLRMHNILLHCRRGTLPPCPGSKGAGPSDEGDVHPRTRSCAIHVINKAGTQRSPLYHEHSSTATCNDPWTSKTKRENRSTVAEHEEAEWSSRISTTPTNRTPSSMETLTCYTTNPSRRLQEGE